MIMMIMIMIMIIMIMMTRSLSAGEHCVTTDADCFKLPKRSTDKAGLGFRV